MKDKLSNVTQSLTDCYESLSDMHGEGILDGFTPEFLSDAIRYTNSFVCFQHVFFQHRAVEKKQCHLPSIMHPRFEELLVDLKVSKVTIWQSIPKQDKQTRCAQATEKNRWETHGGPQEALCSQWWLSILWPNKFCCWTFTVWFLAGWWKRWALLPLPSQAPRSLSSSIDSFCRHYSLSSGSTISYPNSMNLSLPKRRKTFNQLYFLSNCSQPQHVNDPCPTWTPANAPWLGHLALRSNLPKPEKSEKPKAKPKAVPKSPPGAGEKAKAKPKSNPKQRAR